MLDNPYMAATDPGPESRRIHALAEALTTTMRSLDLPMPEGITEAVDDAKALTQTLSDTGKVDRGALVADITDALIDGKDPLKVKGVSDYLNARTLGNSGLLHASEFEAAQRIQVALVEAADDIADVLAAALVEQTEALEASGAGIEMRETSPGAVRHERLGDWAKAQDVFTRIDTIGKAWAQHSLHAGQVQGGANIGDAVDQRILLADRTPTRDEQVEMADRKLTGPAAAARIGLPLSLPADAAAWQARRANARALRYQEPVKAEDPNRAAQRFGAQLLREQRERIKEARRQAGLDEVIPG